MMTASSISIYLRVGGLAVLLICMSVFLVHHGPKANTLIPRFLSFQNQEPSFPQTPSQTSLSTSHPFQIKLNSKYVLSRYLRRQPEYGPFAHALAVVFSETIKDEPLLLTTDSDQHTLRFHSLSSSSSSSAQQIWIVANGNYAVGVGEPPAGASRAEFHISDEGRLTFNGQEKWGYCHIPETRGVALYWFGDDSIPVPKGCVADVILTRADYDFPTIEELDQQFEQAKRRVKRRFA
jgi:hypothetical protein